MTPSNGAGAAHLFPMDFMREGGAKRSGESAAVQSWKLLADSIESLSFQSWEFARNYLMLHVRLSPWLGKKRRKIKDVPRTPAPQQTAPPLNIKRVATLDVVRSHA